MGAVFISIALFGISYSLAALRITNRAKKVDPDETLEQHESGIFIKHGMVSDGEGRGLRPTKILSDYYYDSLTKRSGK